MPTKTKTKKLEQNKKKIKIRYDDSDSGNDKIGIKTIGHLLNLLSLTVITLFYQRNYRKLVSRCCDE